MAAITQVISPVSTLAPPPNPSIPSTFDALAYTFSTSLKTVGDEIRTNFVTEINTLKDQANSLRLEVNDSRDVAVAKATLSTDYAEKMALEVEAGTYSAKEHAVGDLTASGGSAKAWAIDTASPDGTTAKSAKTLAGEAAVSAADALAAKLGAEALLDNFDDRYLGAKNTMPTLDNDGNPLQDGALFYHNVAPKGLHIYDIELTQWINTGFTPTNHSGLSGLMNDDHPQYHNDARGDARYLKLAGGNLTGALNTAKATVASSATTSDIWTGGNLIDWTGTATTTAFPTAPQAGATRTLVCDGTCSFTAGANMLINGVTSGATITCAIGDMIEVTAITTTQFRLNRVKADGTAQVSVSADAIFTADEIITSAGKALILSSNGNVVESKISVPTVGTQAPYNATKTNYSSAIYDPIADVWVVFYIDSLASSAGKAVIATVLSDNTVTFGTPVTFKSALGNVSISTCFDILTNQILVAYSRGTDNFGEVITAKVSGGVITFGTPSTTGVMALEPAICYDLSVNKALLSFRDNSTHKVAVVSVSGTSTSIGSHTTVIGSGSDGYTYGIAHCTSLLTNVISYNSGGNGKILQVKIEPSTFAITLGTAYAVADASGFGGYLAGACLAWIDSLSRLAIVFQNGPSGNYILTAGLYSPSGNSWARATSTDIAGSGYSAPYQWYPSISYSNKTECVLVTYIDIAASNVGKLKYSSTLTQSSLSFGTAVQFQSTTTDMTFVTSSNTRKQSVILTYDNSNPTPAADLAGIAYITTAPNMDKRTRFLGFSKSGASALGAVGVKLPFSIDTNQVGLIPNTKYYLSATDGTTLTTTISGPTVGYALSSTSILILATNLTQ